MLEMTRYLGVKEVLAKPMKRGDYNAYRGWNPAEGEDQSVDGYLVKYEDGYESWCPKDVFEAHNRVYETFSDRMAIELQDLQERIRKLSFFLSDPSKTRALGQVALLLMQAQLRAMQSYKDALEARWHQVTEGESN
jgi:hypothetical protein